MSNFALDDDESVSESEAQEDAPEESEDLGVLDEAGQADESGGNATDEPANRHANKRERKEPLLWDLYTIQGEIPNQDAYAGPQINWNALSNKKWGKDSLLKYLPHPEVSNSIGWAHHGFTGKPSFEQSTLQPNPLLEVEPDGPLPQSHLDYLQEKSRKLVREKIGSPNAFVEDSPVFDILGKLDTSASVALGTVLEEMITANLLPLAEEHVKRCRDLEQEEELQAAATGGLSYDHQNPSFLEWTLPPEEAISNDLASSLSSEGHSKVEICRGMLPSTCPASRIIVPLQEGGSHAGEEANPEKRAALDFCQRQGLRSRFVRKNMYVYHWLLPMAPPDAGPSTPKKKTKYGKEEKKINSRA